MKETNPTTMPLNMGRAAVFFAVWILALSITALPFGANQDSGDPKIDYGMVKQDILKFESVLNEVINTTFSSDPIVVVQKAKGAYLPGYGISLSYAINIHRAVINTPFGQVSRASIGPETKRQRIEDLKDKLIRAMQDNGDNFRQLRKDDLITIVGFFEDRNLPDEPNTNKTIVLSAYKKDLDEFGGKIDRLREFRQRIKIVEY
jgi:hypothetical protein